MKSFTGAVIYTDGSAKPNPGNTGWGVHGFFYNDLDNPKKTIVAKFHLPTTYGYIHQSAYGQNPRAQLVEPVEYLDAFGTGEKNSTNNAAEIDALYFTLDKINSDIEIERIQIFTDSEYLRKGILEWRSGWEKNNFIRQDGVVQENKKRWVRLFSQIDALRNKKVKLEIDWVKGHSDVHGNVLADRLATIARIYTTDDEAKIAFEFSPAKKYWKSEIDRHPFLDFARLYFNSQANYDAIGQYFLANSAKDEFVIGKKLPDTSYCVVKMTDSSDPIIDIVKKKQFEVSKEINSIMMMKLDRIFHPEVYPYIADHADKVLLQSNRSNISLNFIDAKPITVEINPAGLSMMAIEALMFLENLMEQYSQIKSTTAPQPLSNLVCRDITDYFFEDEPDEKKLGKGYKTRLKDSIDQNLVKIDIPFTVIKQDGTGIDKKIPIVLGLDILKRNSLKKIETLDPKVILLTWYESTASFRYACVIETNDAMGIWSNFYADRIFF